ncbi:epidermal growth factor receptor substrate 15-like 1 [Chlorella sorokiniana]|uniref:Epidermal growth factor receptor substrate 15-like 1 n=1 Tax=Chlorella sorokiniana TaxID=3076 RepID=A0A2P6TF85_CHLSO|nr:epidermal growth factor receptor substrate 15-like 1 [Chlorella sorokiniana]|eukprot:PRW32634.1 epidermal growth factor receptor substrate 15-like 1 [Chlorella sorokiniana]
MADPHAALLSRAAELAVAEFQAGAATPSVEDILHLEKRWAKLPGASAGGVSLEDAEALLGAEVLADAPLEFVVAQVLGKGARSGVPPVLTKRQFLSLAHVAEVAQGKAFDLVTAEDALRSQELPATHKKRPPAIREAGIDSWQISAAPVQQPGEQDDAEGDYDAAAALATNAPGPLEGGLPEGGPGRLSRATSLTLAAGPLQHGVKALSRQNSFSGAAGEEAGAPLRSARRQLHNLQSNATSYESAVEMHSDAEREEAAAAAAAGSQGQAGRLLSIPPTPEGPGADDTAGAEAGEGEAPPSAKLRKSWESFGSTPKPGADGTPAAGGQQQMNEAVVAAAMAAGMEFMRQLQAAGVAGGNQPSPFHDINPLRAAAAAAAAAAASPALSAPSFAGAAPSTVAPSPEVQSHSGSAGAAAAGAVVPQQLIAQMMARMNLGEDASAEELAAAAAQLQQQALAKQRGAGPQPAASLQGSVGSVPSGSERAQSSQAAAGAAGEAALRKSWNAFKQDAPQYQQAKPQASQQPEQQQEQQPAGSAGTSPQKQPGRMGPPPPVASPAVTRLVAPPVQGIAGWTAMSREDVQRCQAIFAKKGYPAVGGMERHSAMEYFAKLHMERPLFHQAWQAADLGGDGKLDEREFCLFVQLLRGAQKGWPLPARLSADEAAALLGEAPMPAPPAQPPQLHIDAAHMRSVLHGQGQQPAHSRQASMEHEQSVIQDDSDGASSIDSGIAESVSGMSICSRPSAAPRMPGGPFALGRPSATPHRTGLGSVLGGPGHGASATAGAYLPAAATGSAIARLVPYGSDADVAHNLMELTVHSAQIRYRKPLSTPIFSISVRDSLGRLVELPIDTHPGHYRRETATIHSSAIVRLTSQLRKFPPGAVLFVEVKHWKSDKKRFSTLAWSYCPLDRLVDFGAQAARVRSGPVDLPLLKKPVDLTLRRARRLTSRGPDLHIAVRGVAE